MKSKIIDEKTFEFSECEVNTSKCPKGEVSQEKWKIYLGCRVKCIKCEINLSRSTRLGSLTIPNNLAEKFCEALQTLLRINSEIITTGNSLEIGLFKFKPCILSENRMSVISCKISYPINLGELFIPKEFCEKLLDYKKE